MTETRYRITAQGAHRTISIRNASCAEAAIEGCATRFGHPSVAAWEKILGRTVVAIPLREHLAACAAIAGAKLFGTDLRAGVDRARILAGPMRDVAGWSEREMIATLADVADCPASEFSRSSFYFDGDHARSMRDAIELSYRTAARAAFGG